MSDVTATSRFMASPPSSPDYTEITLTTGFLSVEYGGPPGEATGAVIGPVTIPAARIDPDSGLSIPGTMTVVSYAWTGYQDFPGYSDTPPYRFMAWWIDQDGVAPPALGWAPNTVLGADLGNSVVDSISPGNGFNVDPARGPVVDGTYGYPLPGDSRLSGEVLRNTTSVPILMYLNCRGNGYLHSMGTYSISATVRLSTTPVHGKAWLRGHVARAAVL